MKFLINIIHINKMSSLTNKTKYNDFRSTGKIALATVLKHEKNIRVVEKYIHKNSENSENYDYIYKKILYQIVGDILKGKDLKLLVTNIKNEMVGWNHPTFTDIKTKIDEHDEFIINPFEVEEGVTVCKCGSVRVFTYSKQVRSCDEPMTTFAQCVQCKAKWTYSG